MTLSADTLARHGPHQGPSVLMALRHRTFEVLEVARQGDRSSRWCDWFLIALILVNVAAVTLETVASIRADWGPVFHVLELFSVAVFSVEYVLRVWSCVEANAGSGGTWRQRLRYMVSPLAIIDLVVILPFYLSFIIGVDLRFLRVFRLLRVLKLGRYSPALAMLMAVLREESGTFLAAFFVLGILLVFSASGMYLCERAAQPEVFSSIPAAMWWAMATLTTVGYGDVTPITPLGKVFGGFITLIGIGTAALPAGILASGFVDQLRRRRGLMSREIDRALEDGLIDADEEQSLERLRLRLGLSPDLATDIRQERVDTHLDDLPDTLRAMLPADACPHCGQPVSKNKAKAKPKRRTRAAE